MAISAQFARRFFSATIEVQRLDIADLLEDNPSLKSVLPEAVARAYRKAIKEAERETGLPETSFPPACSWSFEKAADAGFWPE